jgi:hypothetical protein
MANEATGIPRLPPGDQRSDDVGISTVYQELSLVEELVGHLPRT